MIFAILGIFGYMFIALMVFMSAHLVLRHFLDIDGTVSVVMAAAAGLFFPLTIPLSIIAIPIWIVVWYIRNMMD